MKINIEDVLKLRDERTKINEVPLHLIEWYKDGKKVEISESNIKDFLFTGLSNMDFIDDGTPFEWDAK